MGKTGRRSSAHRKGSCPMRVSIVLSTHATWFDGVAFKGDSEANADTCAHESIEMLKQIL